METTDSRFDAFQHLLRSEGERSALAYLNSQSNFRFIALIHFTEGRGNPIHYFDRDNPDITDADELDQRATYCNAVVTHRKPFHTVDSMGDARLQNHPARQSIRSYLGVPILAQDGTAQAVLCSFDQVPQSVTESHRQLLLKAADAFREVLGEFKLTPPVSRITATQTELIGDSTLRVVERMKPGWSSPKYTIERTRNHADGGSSLRLSYGRDGFDSMEEALEFGREWCLALGDT